MITQDTVTTAAAAPEPDATATSGASARREILTAQGPAPFRAVPPPLKARDTAWRRKKPGGMPFPRSRLLARALRDGITVGVLRAITLISSLGLVSPAQAAPVKIEAGSNYSLYVTDGGELFAMGNNFYGQLGVADGTTESKTTPVKVADNVASVAAGNLHSLYVTIGGELFVTGYNKTGQLGDGSKTDRAAPFKIADNVASVAAGDFHSLYVTTNGELYGMGHNANGQLGVEDAADQTGFVFIADNVVSIAAGGTHSLFVTADRKLYAMGNNEYGQLGVGDTKNRNTPEFIADNVVFVAAGTNYSFYVNGNNELYGMGLNSNYQLGLGDKDKRTSPVFIIGNVVSVAAGIGHSLYITTAGELFAMGYNYYGQLGNKNETNQKSSVLIAENVVSVAAGGNHSLFVTADRELNVMGWNNNGQLGKGNNTSINSTPASIGNISAPPSVVTHPQSQTVLAGENATFTVTATGTEPISYQWLFKGNEITGETNDTLALTNVTADAAGEYTVRISNGFGDDATSDIATLTVNTPPAVSSHPQSQTVRAGEDAAFTVTATGTEPISYQWFFNNTEIAGEINDTLALTNVTADAAGEYTVRISNAAGEITSTPAILAVLPATSGANVSLMSLTRETATDAEPGDLFSADSGVFAAVSNLTIRSNNTQKTIGGTGRTPIVFNNKQAPGGWKPPSAVGLDNADAFQIKFSTIGYGNIRFSCTQKSTGKGPDAFLLAYSIGNPSGPYTEIANSRTGTNGIPAITRISDDTYSALKDSYNEFVLPSEMENQTEVYLRVVFSGLDIMEQNGNTSINDIAIIGDEQGGDGAVVNKTALEELIAQAAELDEGEYTNATWPAFAAALQDAQTVFANAASTQAEINAAKNALQSALNALILLADYIDVINWPGDGTVTAWDTSATFLQDSSGLEFHDGKLYLVNNKGGKFWVMDVAQNGTLSFVDGFENGKVITFKNGGEPDAEGVTVDEQGRVYFASERSNNNNSVNWNLILQVENPFAAAATFAATRQWDITNKKAIILQCLFC